MPIPVFILAGQSNAARLSNEIEASLEDEYGAGNFELVQVFDGGAPLTRERADQEDWSNPEELREELTVETVNALLEDDDRALAGVLWVQGEADTYAPGAAEQYSENLEEMLDGFRDDVSRVFGDVDVGMGNAPVTILELSDNAPEAPEREGWNMIIDQQRELAAQEPLIQTLDPDEIAQEANVEAPAMFSDGLHYSDDFSRILADELVQTLVAASEDRGFEDNEREDEPDDIDVVVNDRPTKVVPSETDLPTVDIVDPFLEEGEEEVEFEDVSGLESIFWLAGLIPLLSLLGGLG